MCFIFVVGQKEIDLGQNHSGVAKKGQPILNRYIFDTCVSICHCVRSKFFQTNSFKKRGNELGK